MFDRVGLLTIKEKFVLSTDRDRSGQDGVSCAEARPELSIAGIPANTSNALPI